MLPFGATQIVQANLDKYLYQDKTGDEKPSFPGKNAREKAPPYLQAGLTSRHPKALVQALSPGVVIKFRQVLRDKDGGAKKSSTPLRSSIDKAIWLVEEGTAKILGQAS